jgi:hypothetical protein
MLLQCPYSRAVWFKLLCGQGLQRLLLSSTDAILDWWPQASSGLALSSRRSFNSLCLLVLGSLWLERNARVFEGNDSPATSLAAGTRDEWQEYGLDVDVGEREESCNISFSSVALWPALLRCDLARWTCPAHGSCLCLARCKSSPPCPLNIMTRRPPAMFPGKKICRVPECSNSFLKFKVSALF